MTVIFMFPQILREEYLAGEVWSHISLSKLDQAAVGQAGLEKSSPREKSGAERRGASPEPCGAPKHSPLGSSSGSNLEAPQQTGH